MVADCREETSASPANRSDVTDSWMRWLNSWLFVTFTFILCIVLILAVSLYMFIVSDCFAVDAHHQPPQQSVFSLSLSHLLLITIAITASVIIIIIIIIRHAPSVRSSACCQ